MNVRAAIVLLILMCGGMFLFAQQGSGRSGSGPGGGRPGTGRPGGGMMALAETTEQFHTISLGGRLEPESRIVHQTTAGGYVESILVTEGQSVEAGEELLTIRRKDDVMDLYKPVAVASRIPGRISRILVQVADEVNTGQPAVVIIGTAGYLLKANVSDKDAFRIDVGQRVTGNTAQGTAISGVLVSRSQEPDYETGLFELTFKVSNSSRVNIGEFALLKLPIDRTQGIFVPRDAVIRRYGGFYVWIIDEENRLVPREVTLGEEFEDLFQVTEGIEEGERFLLRLTGREKEGDTITQPEE